MSGKKWMLCHNRQYLQELDDMGYVYCPKIDAEWDSNLFDVCEDCTLNADEYTEDEIFLGDDEE